MATARITTPAAETQPTPETPPADPKSTPAPAATAQVVPFPKPPSWIKKNDPAQAETLSIWARQEKEGIITLCNHRGDSGERCYYPAINVRDSSNNPVIQVDEEGKTFALGKCSYAGELHPPIKMYPKKKEDEI